VDEGVDRLLRVLGRVEPFQVQGRRGVLAASLTVALAEGRLGDLDRKGATRVLFAAGVLTREIEDTALAARPPDLRDVRADVRAAWWLAYIAERLNLGTMLGTDWKVSVRSPTADDARWLDTHRWFATEGEALAWAKEQQAGLSSYAPVYVYQPNGAVAHTLGATAP
jgi:hypothetical protein